MNESGGTAKAPTVITEGKITYIVKVDCVGLNNKWRILVTGYQWHLGGLVG